MVLNLNIVKGCALSPGRLCRKITGEPSRIRMISGRRMRSGEEGTSKSPAAIRSNKRLGAMDLVPRVAVPVTESNVQQTPQERQRSSPRVTPGLPGSLFAELGGCKRV